MSDSTKSINPTSPANAPTEEQKNLGSQQRSTVKTPEMDELQSYSLLTLNDATPCTQNAQLINEVARGVEDIQSMMAYVSPTSGAPVANPGKVSMPDSKIPRGNTPGSNQKRQLSRNSTPDTNEKLNADQRQALSRQDEIKEKLSIEASEKENLKCKIEGLKTENEKIRGQIKSFQGDIAALQSDITVLQGQKDKDEAEKERIKAEIEASKKDLEEIVPTAELSTKIADTKWEEVCKTEDEIQQLTANLKNLQSLYDQRVAELEELKIQIDSKDEILGSLNDSPDTHKMAEIAEMKEQIIRERELLAKERARGGPNSAISQVLLFVLSIIFCFTAYKLFVNFIDRPVI